ncbi:MAG: hypothetical protein RIS90_2820, partial [Pseudomonadota bacterium]
MPWLRRLFWLVFAVLSVWGLSWVLVPPLAKHQLERIASDKLGREIRLERLEFKPWSLELTLWGLSMASAPGSADRQPQFELRRLYVDASLASLFRLAPVVNAVQVEAPTMRLTHLGGGRYDIDDILQRLRVPDAPASAAPPGFALHNLVLSGGSLDLTDRADGKPHALRELSVSLPFLSSLASQREVLVQPQLAFRFNGSRFEASGNTAPFAQTRRADLQLKLKDLDLAPLLAYLPADLPVQLGAAVLSTDLRLVFETVPTTSLRISGSLQADRVKLQVAQPGTGVRSELLAWEQLELGIDDLRPLERQARLGVLTLRGPRLTVSRDAGGQLALPGLTPTNATKKEAGQPDATRPEALNAAPYGGWTLTLARIAVQAGSLSWRDHSTVPAAALALQGLSLTATGLALPLTPPL